MSGFEDTRTYLYTETSEGRWVDRDREVVTCSHCKYATMTEHGECKYCEKFWAAGDDGFGADPQVYLPGDFFCKFGERADKKSDYTEQLKPYIDLFRRLDKMLSEDMRRLSDTDFESGALEDFTEVLFELNIIMAMEKNKLRCALSRLDVSDTEGADE